MITHRKLTTSLRSICTVLNTDTDMHSSRPSRCRVPHLHSGDAGGAADQDDLVQVGQIQLGVTQRVLHRDAAPARRRGWGNSAPEKGGDGDGKSVEMRVYGIRLVVVDLLNKASFPSPKGFDALLENLTLSKLGWETLAGMARITPVSRTCQMSRACS